MTTLIDLFIEVTVAANETMTEQDRQFLTGKRNGVFESIRRVSGDDGTAGEALCAADRYYMDRGIDRPMTGGLFYDWKPHNPR